MIALLDPADEQPLADGDQRLQELAYDVQGSEKFIVIQRLDGTKYTFLSDGSPVPVIRHGRSLRVCAYTTLVSLISYSHISLADFALLLIDVRRSIKYFDGINTTGLVAIIEVVESDNNESIAKENTIVSNCSDDESTGADNQQDSTTAQLCSIPGCPERCSSRCGRCGRASYCCEEHHVAHLNTYKSVCLPSNQELS
ncbi:hypothetical protein B484DRAFT_168475 [Ochromonadaceae sp. CCMP2298]|nr:hypothetical protein B484DRAFT_168475 [Ochromonadaceae sp. CCMP2298]